MRPPPSCRAPILILALVLPMLPGSARAAFPGRGAYQYLSPLPGSRMVSPWNDVVIRQGSPIDPRTVRSQALSVVGSLSGKHGGDWKLSDDSRTLVFKPSRPFSPHETVVVRLGPGVKTTAGNDLPALAFGFSTSRVDPGRQRRPSLSELLPDLRLPPRTAVEPSAAPARSLASACDSFPSGYPNITVLTSDHPDPGQVFIAPFGPDAQGHLLVVDDLGLPLFYRQIHNYGIAVDFKRQPNGLLTYTLKRKYKFYALDSSYAVVDSFATGNGYVTDLHDLQLLPNGHALLMSYDQEPVRMDSVVAGGNPNAIVTGLIVQELDAAKNVVFQWRSWDHYQITDAAPDISLTDSLIDYVHGNAIELDSDGNFLLSARHMNEITKIDRQTGEIIWRLGLNASNNQFDFVNDTRGFSHQHDIRRLPNGDITLFDNGNGLYPSYSKADEYRLDEQAKTAELVWDYRDVPDALSGYMGNVQRREDGGTMIGWGGRTSSPKLTDLHADGTKAFELGFDPYVLTYRAFRFPWRTNRFVTDVDSLDFGDVDGEAPAVLPVTVTNTSTSEVTISCLATTDSAFAAQAPTPFVLSPDSSAVIDVSFSPWHSGVTTGRLYVREIGEDEIVARSVALAGYTSTALAVAPRDAPTLELQPNRPNPFRERTAIRYQLPRPSHVRIEIFDIGGRRVATLMNAFQTAGSHQRTWVVKGKPSGVYLCVLRAGARFETRKLVLMD